MRAIADTNTIVSGLLWAGPSRQVLDAARASTLTLLTSAALLAELEEVLARDKFVAQLKRVGVTRFELARNFAALATLVKPIILATPISMDADDDAVIACAVAARADFIVSGDKHLLRLKTYQDIEILTAAEALKRLPS